KPRATSASDLAIMVRLISMGVVLAERELTMTRTLTVVVAMTLVPLGLAEDNVPKAWTPELMMQVKRVGSVQVSPDGQRVAFTVRQAVLAGDRSEYLTHIHLANTAGGPPR